MKINLERVKQSIKDKDLVKIKIMNEQNENIIYLSLEMIGSGFSTICTISGNKNYQVVDQLGEGSFGNVYLVQDNKGKKYALKKIRIDPFNIEESQKQIQVMKKLSHHNLVKIYDYQVQKDNETIDILMEYCEQGDLFHYYKKKQKSLTIRQILKIFKQIVQAFISMNVKGVFHRDLKPQNILITKGLVIKIADFGCARSISTHDITKVDDFSLDKGTPIYASPQQLMNEKYSSKCDVWSAGVLLYFIYFGEHPFIDQVAHNTLTKIKNKTQNKTIELPKDVDPTISKIIQLTLIFEDQQRASWRQLWLSRLFSEKIQNAKRYVEYLHRLSLIANTMTRMFWVARKPFEISKKKDEIFIYFFIKFQCTIMLHAKQINKKNKKHDYLFAPNVYAAYTPDENFIHEIKKDYADRERFFNSIKQSMKTKEANKQIKQKETKRVSAFSDLDYTLKYGYYILLEIKDQLDGKNKHQIDYKVWTFIAKWINFERWFSFQKEPRIQKILTDAQAISDPKKFILDEIQRYEEGDVV